MELLRKAVENHTDMLLEAERYIWKNQTLRLSCRGAFGDRIQKRAS